MARRDRVLLVGSLLGLLPGCFSIQTPAPRSPLDTVSRQSQATATELVERAAIALGLAAFEAAGAVQLEFQGTSTYTGDWNAPGAVQHYDRRGSYLIAPGWRAVRRESESQHREQESTQRTRDVLAGGRAVRWSQTEDGGLGAIESRGGSDADLARELATLLPHQVVREALEHRPSLRLLDPEAVQGRWGETVTYTAADGRSRALVIELESGLPLRLEDASCDPALGDSVAAVEWSEYRAAGELGARGLERTNLVLPTRRVVWEVTAWRSVNGEETLSGLTLLSRAARGAFEPPAEAELEDWRVVPRAPQFPAPDALEVGAGLTLLAFGDLDCQVLVAEQPDHVIVVEAPVSSAASERVLAAVQRLVPGKRVKTVVVSHHHLHYLGGVRSFAAAGAEIVVTEDAAELVRRLLSWPYAAEPDRLAREGEDAFEPTGPAIRVVLERVQLGEGPARLEVVRIADTGHTDEYLVTFAPEIGLLFQGDLVAFREDGTPASFGSWARGLLRGVRAAGIEPVRVAQSWPLEDRARSGEWVALLDAERASVETGSGSGN